MGDTSTYYGWTPPAADDALFIDSNCGVAAQWLAAFVNSLYNGTDLSDPPLLASYQYMSALTPDGEDVPTFGQVAEWLAYGTENSTLYNWMVQFPYAYCPKEICEKLVWQGDGDLAGVGVMVVYFLAAGFSTLYFILLAADQFEPFRRFELHHRRWNWVVAAFHETVPAFLDTGLIFCISMLISGVYRFGSSRMHPDKSHSIYQLTNATYAGIFSVFPPVLLQIVSPNRRRRRIRAVLWLFVIAMAIALLSLYFVIDTSADKILNLLNRESAVADLIWEFNCEPINLRDSMDYAIVVAVIVLGLNFFPWLYHNVIPRTMRHKIRDGSCIGRLNTTKKGRHGRNWWKHVLAIARTVDGAICCILMWALLGIFTAYRGKVLDAMGPDNANTEWSFSQVFALATWVPVAIDLATIYIYGAREGLEGKVSENFKIVQNSRKNSGDGSGPDGNDGPNDIDYSNLGGYQAGPVQTNTSGTTGHYDPVNTQMQFVGSAGQFSDVQYNNGVFNNGVNNMAQYGGNVNTTYDNTQYGAGGAGNVQGVQGQYVQQVQPVQQMQSVYSLQQQQPFSPQQFSPQYTPQYDTSMTKEAVAAAEAQPMTQYMQPAPYNNNTVSSVQTQHTGGSGHSQPVSYEYMPQDPASMHGGVHQ